MVSNYLFTTLSFGNLDIAAVKSCSHNRVTDTNFSLCYKIHFTYFLIFIINYQLVNHKAILFKYSWNEAICNLKLKLTIFAYLRPKYSVELSEHI